jgi:bacterioferritin (cytochrome b1)
VADDAVLDLLGVLAYAELCAFDRLADDARMAPNLDARARMSEMAATEFGHYRQLAERLTQLGAEPATAMAPFVAALETFHSLTEPQTWLEAVVKAYVGDGLAADFYREVANFVDEDTATLIRAVLTDAGRAEFAVSEVRRALAEQGWLAGRLALWARRLVGEAISQTQHVLADRESLMMLLMRSGGDIAGVGALITHITDRHAERMKELGLDS